MSTIKTNIPDYLSNIETLTNTNLQILKTINDSFFTKKDHLFAEIDKQTYVIPSFISLENKINMLKENFENLVKSPETCEAYFNFDGNSRAIEVKKYSHVPDNITLPVVSSYSVETNDIFKDFLTPVPYINLELPELPNDIVEVNVKKIIAKSTELKNIFKSRLEYEVETTDKNGKPITETHYHNSVNNDYSNIYKLLTNYIEDTDYIEYDTIYKLPIRKSIGTSTYVIESVVSDIIDDDLNEIITLKLRNNLLDTKLNNNLTYKLFDETIEKPLKVGDELINYDGTGKVVITEIHTSTNTLVVKVVNGEYLNFIGTDSYDSDNDKDIHDMSKLKFYSAIDFNKDKYLKIPLEEDQYIFVAVAALNSRMNIQSSWGTGIVIDTYSLKNNDTLFKSYYDNNVKNIGDVLFEVSNMITSPISVLSQDTFEKLINIKPELDSNIISVMQINKHLNNSSTVKNIRAAYNQKKLAESQLSEVQTKINDINNSLTTISFNDTTGIRNAYLAQLSQYNHQKNEILATINNAINTISLNVNSAEIPIENAKYRIRGFYIPNFSTINDIDVNKHIIGLQIQYRYKNMSTDLGTATSINSADGTDTYIYSDWNTLNTKNKLKIASCINGTYTYAYEDNNENKNEPSYNQLDIPISQGETVDIRVKVIYDFGQPYITMMSSWSDIINIEFPEEYTKDVQVLTIIEENNNDIETNRFNSILESNGINDHINDMIMDQNITFFHKPDNIASGFYTDERKIIPLKDKLQSIVNDITELKSDILGGSNKCKISISVGNSDTELYSDRENIITLEPYSNFDTNTTSNDLDSSSNTSNNIIDGVYTYNTDNKHVSVILNLSISNTGNNSIKLYSVFPGHRDITINSLTSSLYKKENYCENYYENNTEKEGGVYIKFNTGADNNNSTSSTKLQGLNQFITFRINDAWTGEKYYTQNVNASTDKQQDITKLPTLSADDDTCAMVVYPFVSTKYGLCLDSNDTRSYIIINPGEELIVPIYCEYVINKANNSINKANNSINKTLSFDLRTSLYTDPYTYSFTVVGKKDASAQDAVLSNNKKRLWDRLTTSSKYNHTIK